MARLNKTVPREKTEREIKIARLAELKAKQAAAAPPEPVAEPVAEPVSGIEQKQARLNELKAKAAGPKEKEAWYEDFGEGLAVSGMELYYGAKDLVGQMDEEDKATLTDWQEDAAESGWGTGGRVVGELAQFMIPGGAALKGVRGLSMLKKASNLKKTMAVMGAEGAAAGAVGGTRLPGEDETRLGNMAKEGALGVAGAGIIPLLSKGARGLTKTKEAMKLLDEGVDLSPGQMAQSQAISGLETAAEVTPFLARGTKLAKKKGTDSWNLNIMNQAAPEGVEITKIGPEGGAQLKTAFNNAYDKAWQGSGKLSKTNAEATITDLAESSTRLGTDDAKVLESTAREIALVLDKGVGNKGGKLIDDILRRRLKATTPDKYDLTEALKEAKNGLRRRMPRKTQEQLDKIDAKYPKYLTVRKAIGNSDTADGVFTPNILTKADKAVSKGRSEVGESLFGEAARLGRATVGKKEGGAPLEWFRRIATAFPSPPGMPLAGRGLMGQTGLQKGAVRAASSPRAQQIRELMSGGGASAALFSE